LTRRHRFPLIPNVASSRGDERELALLISFSSGQRGLRHVAPRDSVPKRAPSRSLVVVEGDTMVGIITERDILRACDGGRGCITDQLVADQMTKNPLVGSPHHDAVEVMELMTNQRIRHLPVIEDGELIGIISMGDVVKAQSSEMARENYFLKSYIQS
jgi:CBS domain-containing protein